MVLVSFKLKTTKCLSNNLESLTHSWNIWFIYFDANEFNTIWYTFIGLYVALCNASNKIVKRRKIAWTKWLIEIVVEDWITLVNSLNFFLRRKWTKCGLVQFYGCYCLIALLFWYLFRFLAKPIQIEWNSSKIEVNHEYHFTRAKTEQKKHFI